MKPQKRGKRKRGVKKAFFLARNSATTTITITVVPTVVEKKGIMESCGKFPLPSEMGERERQRVREKKQSSSAEREFSFLSSEGQTRLRPLSHSFSPFHNFSEKQS